MRKFLHALTVMAWLAATAALAWWTRKVMLDITGADLIANPLAGLLAFMLLCAGMPRRRVKREKTVLRIRFAPKGERRTSADLLRLRRETRLRPRFGILRIMALMIAVGIVAGDCIALEARSRILAVLPADRSALLNYDPPITTRVFASQPDGSRGELVCEFTNENRVKVPLAQIPIFVRRAFISAEDKTFYQHHGIDLVGIVRAAAANFEGGAAKQGASTLTQQVVKQVLLHDSSKTIARKVKEIMLAIEIERRLSKEQILEAYLNHVFLGRGAYGVEAAARTYFGKSVGGLTVAEAALLAGMPKAPSSDSPVTHFARARGRQHYVLDRMAEDGAISRDDAERAKRAPVLLIAQVDPVNDSAAPYFCDLARRELKRLYGNKAVFEEGLTVESTLDMRMQRAAEAAVRSGLIDLERRIGWNGPEGHDDSYSGCNGATEGIADGRADMARIAARTDGGFAVCLHGRLFPMHPDDAARMRDWEARTKGRIAVGDQLTVMVRTLPATGERSKLSATGRVLKRPESAPGVVSRYAVTAQRIDGPGHPEALQAALMSVEPSSGELKAYVGGYDFAKSKFNIPIMARRQPGSSIKPNVYLTALMNGVTAADKVNDSRACYATSSGQWCPENYKGPDSGKQYYGELWIGRALALSLNSVSVKLIARFGVDNVIGTMRKLGYASPLKRVLALAIGAADVTLWEHTMAYSQLAANGAQAPSHPWETSALDYATAHVNDATAAAAEDAPRRGIFFRKVTDRRGKVLMDNPKTKPEQREQAVPSGDAYALLHLMKGVVQDGTGKRARELGRPVAAKTGTTNDFRDVWFMGCTPDLCTGTWVGRMTPMPIVKEATGGAVALPIWLAFMEAAHPKTPPRDFPIPSDIVMMPDGLGGLVPYQRGRVPEKLLSGTSLASGHPRSPF